MSRADSDPWDPLDSLYVSDEEWESYDVVPEDEQEALKYWSAFNAACSSQDGEDVNTGVLVQELEARGWVFSPPEGSTTESLQKQAQTAREARRKEWRVRSMEGS